MSQSLFATGLTQSGLEFGGPIKQEVDLAPASNQSHSAIEPLPGHRDSRAVNARYDSVSMTFSHQPFDGPDEVWVIELSRYTHRD